jgi:hypothetical protein
LLQLVRQFSDSKLGTVSGSPEKSTGFPRASAGFPQEKQDFFQGFVFE